LFVVRAGETDSQVAAKVLEDFKQKNLVGVVLNRVERGDGYGGYYYSYPSYGSKSGKS
jgi:Mrp family chromosome partitioning ATPase